MRSASEFLTFADTLRAASDVTQTLRVIADSAVRMTVSNLATVRLLDPDRGEVLATAHHGDGGRLNSTNPYDASVTSGATAWCLEHKQPLFIVQPGEDERVILSEKDASPPSGLMAVPLLERDRVVGVVCTVRRDGWPFTEHDLDTLRLLGELASPFIQIDRLRGLAERDALTGLYNRYHLDRLFPKLLYRAQRRAEPLSAIMLDLDKFGDINKEFGWHVGDLALCTAADTIQENTRIVDTVVRTGGEEFLILLPGATVDAAEIAAERLRAKMIPASFEHKARHVKLSASLGAGPVLPGDNVAAVIERLGKAVKRAKERGRNFAERTHPADATWETFFDRTRADWSRVPAPPEREPDYESAVGSRFWDAGNGVYRAADHWNADVGGCDWLLDGEVVAEDAVGFMPYPGFELIIQRPAVSDPGALPRLKWPSYRNIVVLTGDGIMPPRGDSGDARVWDRLDARSADRLDAARLAEDVDLVREAFLTRAERARKARPNGAHRALAELEQRLEPPQSMTILTQNIDGLHQRAGNGCVVELHGRLSWLRCMDATCGLVAPTFPATEVCRDCGSPMRPDVVLTGESLPARIDQDVKRALRGCDLFLAVGVSCAHTTAQRIVRGAVYEGAQRIRIHPEALDPQNPAFHTSLSGSVEEILRSMVLPPGRSTG